MSSVKGFVICSHVKKPRPKTRKFTREKGTVIVIAQNRRTGEVGEGADSRGGKRGRMGWEGSGRTKGGHKR